MDSFNGDLAGLQALAGVTMPVTATPSISPAGGILSGSLEVTLACTTPGATIYYTLDGSVPTASSLAYTSPFKLTTSATVTAIAFAMRG